MKIPAKTDYACKALLELSLHWPNTAPRQIAEIAAKQKIPTKFLTHILIALKGLGYVDSTRGKTGGYYLTTPPQSIKLIDIITNFGGFDLGGAKRKKSQDVLDLVWQDIDVAIAKAFDQITFETIINRHRSAGKTMMYEI
jgi:Rrf2 family protein